jgi:hypothetical protein
MAWLDYAPRVPSTTGLDPSHRICGNCKAGLAPHGQHFHDSLT